MHALKKKVLLVGQDSLGKGGIQSVIMSIVSSLSEEYTFDIILLKNEFNDYNDEFINHGGKIFCCPTYQGENNIRLRADYYVRGMKLYRFTRKIIRENGPYQVIHCNAAIESAVFIVAAYKENIPIRLVYSHGIHNIKSENFIRQGIDKLYISYMRKYSTKCMGNSILANITHFGIDCKAAVINVPYDNVRFDPSKYEQKKRSNRLIITQVGQYCPNKNQLFTVNVFSKIVEMCPEAKLNFVGFDSIGFLPILNKEIQKCGLQDKIDFYSKNANIPLLLSQSDFFIFPSYSEGFGIVLIEAQAMGVRCFVSDTVPKETDCGGCTYLPLSLGAEKWAEIITEDYKKTGGAHGNFDCSRFSDKEVAKQYKKIYEGEFQ